LVAANQIILHISLHFKGQHAAKQIKVNLQQTSTAPK